MKGSDFTQKYHKINEKRAEELCDLVRKALEDGTHVHFGCHSIYELQQWEKEVKDLFHDSPSELITVDSVAEQLPQGHVRINVRDLC